VSLSRGDTHQTSELPASKPEAPEYGTPFFKFKALGARLRVERMNDRKISGQKRGFELKNHSGRSCSVGLLEGEENPAEG